MDCTLIATGRREGPKTEYTCQACRRGWWSHHPPERLHRNCRSLLARHHVPRGPCIHRGGELRQQESATCRGNVRVKVFACALHGECTLEKPLPGGGQVRVCSVCPDRRADDRPPKLLIAARHGLGDAVQLTVVLAHLRHHYPGAHIEIATHRGRTSIYRGQADAVHTVSGTHDLARFAGDAGRPAPFDAVYDLGWFEPIESFSDYPSTKAERCLREVFQIEPIEALCRKYTLHVSEPARQRVRAWLSTLPVSGGALAPGGPAGPAASADRSHPRFALLHYEGSSAKEAKDLSHHDAEWLCRHLWSDFGLTPIVLDWGKTCPFARSIGDQQGSHQRSAIGDQPTASSLTADSFPAFRWDNMPQDAETIAALISEAALFVGIDSGPLHVAAATETPTIACWTGFHPVHYLCPADNVLNLVPPHHIDLIRGDRARGLAYFQSRYRHKVYQSFLSFAYDCIADAVRHPGYVWRRGHWIRSDNQDQDLVIVQDVYEGDCYRLAETPIPREVIVDVGACFGSFAKKAHERNPTAQIICCECEPENVKALEKNVGQFATIVAAAVTYEQDVALLNAVYPGCMSTGGSTVLSRAEVERYRDSGPERQPGVSGTALAAGGEKPFDFAGYKREYWADLRPLATVTLEQLGERYGFARIDLLKLDCEGSEFSILEHCDLSRIRRIVGEYHGRARFDALIARRFGIAQPSAISDQQRSDQQSATLTASLLTAEGPLPTASSLTADSVSADRSSWTLEILREGEIGLFRLNHHAAAGIFRD